MRILIFFRITHGQFSSILESDFESLISKAKMPKKKLKYGNNIFSENKNECFMIEAGVKHVV